jgi:hypothetical protein
MMFGEASDMPVTNNIFEATKLFKSSVAGANTKPVTFYSKCMYLPPPIIKILNDVSVANFFKQSIAKILYFSSFHSRSLI